ncbi:MAG: riboflavin synthase [Phycisphaerae bacterium]|nr:riboflavin synthase [Phycisphaerae bacterium]
MFTGLVQHVGVVAAREETPFGARFAVAVGNWPESGGTSPHAADAPSGSDQPPLSLGESIAVSGCCLTLARIEADQAKGSSAHGRTLGFDVIHQTLQVTALGRLATGHRLNLERSATPRTLLGGHIVQGHVDGLGTIDAILREGGEWRVRVQLPTGLLRYVHDKGSIAIDGVSLTVAALDDCNGTMDVCLIPETLARTTLGDRVVGDTVHLEADCLAKMVARLVSTGG